jgi:uncharacterized membrane protein YhaH (DUF805 family)
MNPIEAVSSVFSKYATFEGRASRSEFWWWWGVTVMMNILIASTGDQTVLIVFWLAIFIPNLAVTVRRHHDGNRSGWFILLCLIPLIGPLILFFLYVSKGTEGSNQYGLDPLGPDVGETDGYKF